MENVVLTVHLILAVLLTGVVLLQRSEGGGLGIGGGGGSGVMTGRQAANVLTRLTWILGVALFATSIALTIIAARQVSNNSIMDQLGVPASRQADPGLPAAPTYVPPPSSGSAGDPLTPPAPDAAATATAPAAPAAPVPAPAAAPSDGPVTPPAEVVTPPAPVRTAPSN